MNNLANNSVVVSSLTYNEAPVGISALDKRSALTKKTIALTIMIIPFAGACEAAHLVVSGRMTRVDASLFAIMYCVHMAGVSIGYHRLLTHRAFNTSRWFRALILISGSMGAQGPILFWVTTHRRHHAYSDREGDPHSPNLMVGVPLGRLRGLWYAHMPWMLAPEMSSWAVYAKDILKDRSLFFYNKTYPYWVLLGVAFPTVIGGVISGTWAGAWGGFIFGGLARICIANQLAWCVGSICHRYGRRPFQTDDNSTNNWLVALLTFGEGLQNNHHAFPAWYRHGVRWWEPDISGWILTFLGKIGIVWDLRNPSDELIARVRKRTSEH